MEKLDLTTPNFTNKNVAKLAELFPSCVTEKKNDKGEIERAIDFDALRQEFSDTIVEGPQERYSLNWPGKREALVKANTPISKTLRPYRDESVDFDNTKNIFIEGHNLDALKLLQEAYLSKIKMIYIDPPYNTGKDFIYKDNFTAGKEKYDEASGQRDEEGGRLVANPDSNGRFHSDWLSTIYSPLKLARNLLREDGVIFISIDDNEQANLKRICDEVFGEENFIGNIIWKNVTDNNPTNIATEHEYIVAYAKSKRSLEKVWKSKLSEAKNILIQIGEEMNDKYVDQETLQKQYSNWFKEHKYELWPLENYKFIDDQGVYSGERGVHNPGKEGYRYDIIHPDTQKPCKEPLMGYRFPEETMSKMIDDGRIIFGEDEDKLVEIKVYAKDYKQKLGSVFNLDGRTGANELKELFPDTGKIFTNPKTIKLLGELISFATGEGDIILDFFTGSGSTAHAIMKLNSDSGESRKFIVVQLDEKTFDIQDGKEISKTGTSGEAYKNGYKTIAEISKERIRRAGKKIKEENADKHGIENLDIGFRVFKIDSSNMVDVTVAPDEAHPDMFEEQVGNLKEDRLSEDLLFQVLLDWGVDLSLPINREEIERKEVFFVDGDALAACFEEGVNEDFVKKLAEEQPLRVVFRDDGFVSDSVKINVEQIFKLKSPATDIKVI